MLWGNLGSLCLGKGVLFHFVWTLKKKTGYRVHSRKVTRSSITQSHCPTIVRQVSSGKAGNQDSEGTFLFQPSSEGRHRFHFGTEVRAYKKGTSKDLKVYKAQIVRRKSCKRPLEPHGPLGSSASSTLGTVQLCHLELSFTRPEAHAHLSHECLHMPLVRYARG